MAQGVVKSYDPNSGSGIVILDTDKTEVYIQPGSLKDSIFRTLRQGQRINFGQVFIILMTILKIVLL